MLYLSQRKILQITGSGYAGGGRDGDPAQQTRPPALSPTPAYQQQAGQLPAGSLQAPASGAGESRPQEGEYSQPRRILPRGDSNQAHRNSDPDPDVSLTQQPQPNQPQPPTPPNPYALEVKVGSEGKVYLDAEITKTDNKIKENKKSFKFRLMTAAFLGFCSICIGIGANMKYGVGEMSAFESLAGKRGAGGTAENLWNSGSTTDPRRGINYGFAIAGFTLPIVGTIFSLIFAAINYNTINKGEKDNKLRRQAIAGFSLSRTVNQDIHPNHEKIQEKIIELSSGAPHSNVAPEMAVQLARVNQRESRTL